VRCSLLTLSSYLDGELLPERTGELEAHLIACTRCSTGLGYLREEAERIRGLSPARVPAESAERMLVTVGLVAAPAQASPAFDFHEPRSLPPEPAMSPGIAPQFEPTFDFSPGLIGTPYMPAPSHVQEPPQIDEQVHVDEVQAPPVQELPVQAPPVEETAAIADEAPVIEESPALDEAPVQDEAPVTHEPAVNQEPPAIDMPEEHADVEVAGTARRVGSWNGWSEPTPAMPATFEPRQAEPPQAEPPLMEPAAIEPALIEPPQPPPVGAPRGVAATNFLDRIRDAIAVRMALMRGSRASDEDLDDSVQIVSGAGAPDWTAHPKQRERHGRIGMPYASAIIAPDAVPDIVPPAGIPAPQEISPPHDIETPHDVSMPMDITMPMVEDTPIGVEPVHGATIHAPEEGEAESVGRHQRALQRARGMSRPWAGRSFRPRMPSISRPGGRDHIFADPRLGAFGAVVVLLLVIGLLVGKHATPLVSGNTSRPIPNPTAIANVPPNVVATPAPTAQAVQTPAPSVAPTPSPLQLTGIHTLGTGASGVTIQDLRYGSHPNDFRIVFDMSGASGTPKVIAGFGSSTTLYVEFTGVSPAGDPASPNKGFVVTSAKLLDPSPVADRTIYEFTLTHAVKLSTLYLTGPTRLVLDLS
jgi:Putative zinc-finger